MVDRSSLDWKRKTFSLVPTLRDRGAGDWTQSPMAKWFGDPVYLMKPSWKPQHDGVQRTSKLTSIFTHQEEGMLHLHGQWFLYTGPFWTLSCVQREAELSKDRKVLYDFIWKHLGWLIGSHFITTCVWTSAYIYSPSFNNNYESNVLENSRVCIICLFSEYEKIYDWLIKNKKKFHNEVLQSLGFLY